MLHIKHLNSVFFFLDCSDTSSSATSQYHAQLYSGQKQLQKRHQLQQEQKKQLSLPPQHPVKPTSLNYKVLSFDAPNLYHTSLKLTTEIDIHAWWASLVKIFSGECCLCRRLFVQQGNAHVTPIGMFRHIISCYSNCAQCSSRSKRSLCWALGFEGCLQQDRIHQPRARSCHRHQQQRRSLFRH